MYYQAGDDNNIQAAADGNNIQTLYLMNPSSNYIQGYTDTQQQVQHHQQQQQSSSNMIFLNGHALHTASISHAPLQQAQHFVGVPLPSDQGLIHRLWGGNGSHHHSQVPPSSSTVVSASTTDLASQLGFGQRPMPLSPQQQQQGARGLSLSLSPHQQQVSFNNISSSSTHHQNQVGGLDGISNMILASKYLKVAQELLDEVVNVGNNKEKVGMNNNNESMTNLASDVNTTTISGGESSKQKNGVVELTTAQRQELQMKKVKLVTMLEEVEQRYRQYHHQMQIIVSSFEQVAGIGSAKSYTQLAIHAISKQFRCLKDAIIRQIKATSKNLGEEDQEGLKIEGSSSSSRLKFVDHHLRQQRALQQLGMMQPNAWRPQRGLPERAVSVLRAWLFEHFLHPYPKDSDKIMLAKQTGLTRSQVSNWFINARVRLWKPMVEEMYIEEVKNNQDQPNNTSSQENKNQNDQDQSNKEIMVTSNKPTTPREISTSPNGFSFINNDEKNTKKPRNHHDMQNMNNSPSSIVSIEESNKGLLLNNNNPLMAAAAYNTMGDHFGRFNNDPMATNFLGNNLTLGLPHPSDHHHHHQTLALQGNTTTHQQNYISNHQNISFEDIDFQNGKRFSTQLLPDFVT